MPPPYRHPRRTGSRVTCLGCATPMEQRTNARSRASRRGVPSQRLAAQHPNVPPDSSRRDQTSSGNKPAR